MKVKVFVMLNEMVTPFSWGQISLQDNCLIFFLFLKESKTKEKEMETKDSEIEFGPAPKRTR